MRVTPRTGAYPRTLRCPCTRRVQPEQAPLETPLPCSLPPHQGGIAARGPPRPTSWRCCNASRDAVPPGHRAASSLSPWSSRCWRVAGDATDGCRGADLPAVGRIDARALAGRNAALIGVYCKCSGCWDRQEPVPGGATAFCKKPATPYLVLPQGALSCLNLTPPGMRCNNRACRELPSHHARPYRRIARPPEDRRSDQPDATAEALARLKGGTAAVAAPKGRQVAVNPSRYTVPLGDGPLVPVRRMAVLGRLLLP